MAHDKQLGQTGFAQGGLYNSARPRYPEAAINYFVDTFALDAQSHALDLGAGTGIFTRQLLAYVGRVTAVEPSESMRATFAQETPGVTVLDGSDVAIPLDDHQVSAVFAAQAFHWFDHHRALLEIHRVLTPGGGLGLIWNERDTEVAWIRDLNHAMLWDIHQPYDPDINFEEIVASGPFEHVHTRTFHHVDVLAHRQVVERVLTTSYITLLDEDDRATLLSDVSRVLAHLSDPVEMPYVTNVYSAVARQHA